MWNEENDDFDASDYEQEKQTWKKNDEDKRHAKAWYEEVKLWWQSNALLQVTYS